MKRTLSIVLVVTLLTAFALLGVALASLGIYGVIARTVAQRSGEFGIRMALGAQISNIVQLVLTAGMRLALIGTAIGLFGAYGLSRLLASTMPNMNLSTGLIITLVSLALILVALLACYLPARKAARINPVQALRME